MVEQPADSGRIVARDIDDLQQVVWPWRVILRQMSAGQLYARMDYLQVNGIVLYREHWSHRILATGETPPGFFFFGGPSGLNRQIGWCGAKLSPACLAFARPSSETDFFTPDEEDHICLLVPKDPMLRYLGDELAARVLPDEHFLSCRCGCGIQLLQMMERMLDNYSVQRQLLAEGQVAKAIEWQLMGGLVEFLLTNSGSIGCPPRSARCQAVLGAIELCERSRHPIPVDGLAAASGVSRRVLELGFQEIAQTTPRQFMRWNRMNRVRKELYATYGKSSSVTRIASGWGITELGRFAVDYKNLFAESPSMTLARRPVAPPRRMSDVMHGSDNKR